jgi:hypothetical protein
VEPGWLPLRLPLSVSLRLGAGASADHTGLFEESADGRRFVGGADPAAPGTVSGRARMLGAFFAARDTVAPVVGEARVIRERRPPTPAARPSPLEVRWRASDSGAGLDPLAAALEIDGRRVAVALDPEVGGYCWRPLVPPARGSHAYRIEAVDRLGNRATRAGTIRIR